MADKPSEAIESAGSSISTAITFAAILLSFSGCVAMCSFGDKVSDAIRARGASQVDVPKGNAPR